MKKKKDAVFDELKAKILKPLKTLPTAIKDYLQAVSNYWKDEVPQDFYDPAKLAGDEDNFFKSLSGNPDVLTYMQT